MFLSKFHPAGWDQKILIGIYSGGLWETIFGNIIKQECIPAECVPSASVVISPAMHAPCHTYPPPCACPLPCMPPMHAPLWCMPPCDACPLSRIPPPPMPLATLSPHLVDRILDTCLWKHYLSATTVADGNNQHIYLKNNNGQFYCLLGRAELRWNFPSLLSDAPDIYKFPGVHKGKAHPKVNLTSNLCWWWYL